MSGHTIRSVLKGVAIFVACLLGSLVLVVLVIWACDDTYVTRATPTVGQEWTLTQIFWGCVMVAIALLGWFIRLATSSRCRRSFDATSIPVIRLHRPSDRPPEQTNVGSPLWSVHHQPPTHVYGPDRSADEYESEPEIFRHQRSPIITPEPVHEPRPVVMLGSAPPPQPQPRYEPDDPPDSERTLIGLSPFGDK